MAVKAGTAYVDIEGNFSSLNRQVASHFKRLDTQAEKTGKKAGGKFRAGLAAGVTAGAKVGALGVGALGAEVFRATKGWSEHVALQKRSRAVIKSTGEAAGVSARHVEKLSDSIERQTGIDGDLIQNGANLLLTFTNIRNEVGKNNKIYDQATRVTANMSKALGQDTKSSAIQLGKALNDPVKGITALSRVGVSFTQKQKDQIETLVKSGKTMDAQKIILKELNKEFPKVKATPFERLLTVGRKLEDTLGKAVLPVFNKFITDITPGVERIADKLDAIFSDKKLSLGEKLNKAFEAIKVEVQPLVDDLLSKLREANLGDKIFKLMEDAAPEIAEGLKTVGTKAAGALWKGFKEAPLWAQVLGAGFVAKAIFGGGGAGGGKYGAFSSAGSLAARAFRSAFEMGAIKLSVLKGSLGKVATFFTARGSTPTNPVFVEDITGGGSLLPTRGKGKPGAPVPVPGGGKTTPPVPVPPTSKLGKLKPLLKGVGKLGAVGAAINLGINLIDSKGDPIRAVANTASDLTFGIIPRMKPVVELTGIDKQIKDAQEKFEKAQPKPTAGVRGGLGPLTTGDKTAAAAAAVELGTLYTTKLKGVIDTAELWSPDQFQKQARKIISDKSIPEAARKQAATQMSAYALELEQKGVLPKGAAATVVANFEKEFGKLKVFGQKAGESTMSALARSLKGQEVINAISSNIQKWRTKFGGLPNLGKLTGENFTKNISRYLGPNGFLTKQIEAGVSGATAAYKKLSEDSGRYLRRMTGSSAAAAKELSKQFGGQGAAGAIQAWRDQIVTTDPVIARHSDRLRDARSKMRGLKKGSEEYNEAQKKVRVEQKIINDRLLNTIDIAPRTRTQVKKLGINFMNLGGNAEDAAGLIAAATNMVLSGLGADTIRFSLRRSQEIDRNFGNRGPAAGHQRGGPINGTGIGDKVPAMLEPGEYVVNRKAVRKVGKRALDRLNFADAPRFQQGGIVELLHPFNDPAGHGGGNSHLHVAMSTVAGIIALGKRLQRLGWLVSENPAFGGVAPGAHDPDGWHPKGLAIDVNWPDASKESSKIRALLPSLGGTAAGGAGGVAALLEAPKIGKLAIDGPAGMMKDMLVATERKMRTEAQKYVDSQVSFEGAEPGVSTNASGNGADLMRKIAKARGWNFSDWWELDRRESSHGANLTNPTSSARLRGQFLDSNYGKYGPGSDPSKNPNMGQQIQSMAQYIAQRYGNPTQARQFHDAHNYYRSGGLVGMLRGGVAKKKGAKAKNKKLDNLRHHKSHKPKSHLSKKMVASLGNAGATGLQAVMDTLRAEADKYADWATRANDITNTDALQEALNAEMTLRGGRSEMTEQELLKKFPAADQDAFINTWLRKYATFNGGIQSDWLTKELNQLLAWRNALIENPPIFQTLLDAAKAAYKKLKAELKRIASDITMYENRREKARQQRDYHQDKLKEARDALEKDEKLLAEVRGKKSTPARRRRIRRIRARIQKHHERIGYRRSKISDARNQIEAHNHRLRELAGQRRNARAQTQILGGDDGEPGDTGESGRIGALTESITDMGTSLIDVHGLGSTMQKLISPSQFQLGTLGGTILGVQNEILSIQRNPLRASATEAAANPDEKPGEEQTKEILKQLLREANLRTAVSEAQFQVFKGLPFGGSFQEGGTVPGPIGAPRMILAHGGEYVVSNDGNVGPNVSINFANGMEWLKQFVDVRVDNQTRSQGRRGERQLPGRAGVLR